MNLGVIGGPQGPKALLDAVRDAVREGNIDALSRLSEDFLSINDNVTKCRDDSGNTIVHLALEKSPTTLEYVIVALHADVNSINTQGRTPLHEAVTHNYVECCGLLLEHGADDTVQSTTQSTPFHTAAACGSVECMAAILSHSDHPEVKVNEVDRQHSSALHKCAFDGDARVSRWLVEHGATVDVADSSDSTPLLLAVKMGQAVVAEYLLQLGADGNRQDQQGNSGLHFCAVRCDVGVTRLLLNAGANPRLLNVELNSPLHLAALHARPDSPAWEEVVGLLLAAGCDPMQLNAAKKKPADYVGRGLKRIFTADAQQQQACRTEKAREDGDAALAEAAALCAQWKTKTLADVATRRACETAEEVRLAKEAEERVRAAGDARMAYEEAVVRVRALKPPAEKVAAAK